MTKRIIDILLIILALPLIIIMFLMIYTVIRVTSKGPVIYWSKRIGEKCIEFDMPKFRTMKVNTPVLASHLLSSPENYLTSIGKILRKFSLDELPQLWSVFKGDMTLVGPRPALFNQYDLIKLRNTLGINNLVPGLTGWAQINGRDEISISKKVEFDLYYLNNKSIFLDIKIFFLTLAKIILKLDISH